MPYHFIIAVLKFYNLLLEANIQHIIFNCRVVVRPVLKAVILIYIVCYPFSTKGRCEISAQVADEIPAGSVVQMVVDGIKLHRGLFFKLVKLFFCVALYGAGRRKSKKVKAGAKGKGRRRDEKEPTLK